MFQNFSGFLLSPPPRRPPLPPLLLPPPLLHAARNAAVAAPPATPRKPRRVKAAPLDCVGIECSSPMAAPLARHRPFVVERPQDVVVLCVIAPRASVSLGASIVAVNNDPRRAAGRYPTAALLSSDGSLCLPTWELNP